MVKMAAEAGQLQLNVMEPVIAACILESQTLFINACRTLRELCVDGIKAGLPHPPRAQYRTRHSA